jgi:hypothetical protein
MTIEMTSKRNRIEPGTMGPTGFLEVMHHHMTRALATAKDPDFSLEISEAHLFMVTVLEKVHRRRFGASAIALFKVKI